MAVGNYAQAKGINKNGLRRREFSDNSIKALHRAYMGLIRGHGERATAIELLENDIRDFPEVARFVQFVQRSERGVVR